MRLSSILLSFSLLLFSLNAQAATYKKYSVKSGETIYSILKKFYFSKDHINKILVNKKQFEKVYTLSVKQLYWVGIDDKEKKTIIKFFHPQKDESLTLWRQGGEAAAIVGPESFNVKTASVKGKVKGSIVVSIQNVIPSQKVAYRFLDAYKFQYNLRKQIQRNAKFSIVVEKKFLGDQFVKYGEILRTSLEIAGSNQTRYFIASKSGGSFINVKDMQFRRPLYAPVDYLRITSLYQKRRFHPIKKRRIAHLGVDFELPLGSNIYASQAGVVIKSGRTRGAGRYVVIKHNEGLTSYYNHMSSIRPRIKKGVSVKNGEVIGGIGCSGYCTKPHLHFAVKKNGRFVNPANFLKSYPYVQKDNIWDKVTVLRENPKSILY